MCLPLTIYYQHHRLFQLFVVSIKDLDEILSLRIEIQHEIRTDPPCLGETGPDSTEIFPTERASYATPDHPQWREESREECRQVALSNQHQYYQSNPEIFACNLCTSTTTSTVCTGSEVMVVCGTHTTSSDSWITGSWDTKYLFQQLLFPTEKKGEMAKISWLIWLTFYESEITNV